METNVWDPKSILGPEPNQAEEQASSMDGICQGKSQITVSRHLPSIPRWAFTEGLLCARFCALSQTETIYPYVE
jgi:hypothetical protein